jgi:hypothetical protein
VGSDTIKEALLGILVKKSVSSGIRDYLYLVDQQIFLDWVQTVRHYNHHLGF